MATTKTDICNYALSLVGEQVVTDVENSDEGQHAVWANRLYDPTKREVLRSHKWGSARKREALAELAANPAFGYDHAYQLPNDFIRIVSVNDTDPDDVRGPVFERLGNALYTDEDSLKLDYVANVDEGLLDPLLVQSIYFLLASKLAWSIQQNRTLREEMKGEFREALSQAKYTDSVDNKKPLKSQRADSNWIPSRYSSTNG